MAPTERGEWWKGALVYLSYQDCDIMVSRENYLYLTLIKPEPQSVSLEGSSYVESDMLLVVSNWFECGSNISFWGFII